VRACGRLFDGLVLGTSDGNRYVPEHVVAIHASGVDLSITCAEVAGLPVPDRRPRVRWDVDQPRPCLWEEIESWLLEHLPHEHRARDARLRQARERLADRERALKLARDDPDLAIEVGTGRPDLPGADHRGVVDVNHAPAQVIQTLPGVGDRLADQIIDARDRVGGFASVARPVWRRVHGPVPGVRDGRVRRGSDRDSRAVHRRSMALRLPSPERCAARSRARNSRRPSYTVTIPLSGSNATSTSASSSLRAISRTQPDASVANHQHIEYRDMLANLDRHRKRDSGSVVTRASTTPLRRDQPAACGAGTSATPGGFHETPGSHVISTGVPGGHPVRVDQQ